MNQDLSEKDIAVANQSKVNMKQYGNIKGDCIFTLHIEMLVMFFVTCLHIRSGPIV